MRIVATRVTSAAVTVDGTTVAAIDELGLLLLVGITHRDSPETARSMARKVSHLRILPGELSCLDADAPVLVVSQFTLYGDTSKGRRPSWSAAAPRPVAEPLIEEFVTALRDSGISVATGIFGATMTVTSSNDGPFTMVMEL